MAEQTQDKKNFGTDGKLKDNTKDGVLGEVSKMASSFFLSLADPNITKVNPNSQTPTKVNEKLKSFGGTKIDELIKTMKSKLSPIIGDKFGLGDLIDAVDFKNGFSINPEVLQQRLGGQIGQYVSAAKSAMDMVSDVKKNGLASLTKYGGVFGANINNYIQEGMNLYKIAKDVNPKDLSSLLGAASKFLGGSGLGKFLDLQAEAAWLGALVSKAQQLGVPSLIQKLQRKIKDSQQFRRDLTRNLRYNASSGDTKMLSLITQILEGKSIIKEHPDFIQLYLSAYKFPEDYKYEKMDEYRDEVLNILYRVDENWDRVAFGNDWIYKTEPWVKASKDAKLLFVGTKWEESILLAPSYPSQTMVSLLKNQYKHYYHVNN